MSMFNPPHPGLVLREYLGKSAVSTAAEHLGVSRVTLSRVLNGRAGVSADLALRLADAFGTSPELWAGMQSQYDLWVASRRRRKKVAHLHRVPKLARSVGSPALATIIKRWLPRRKLLSQRSPSTSRSSGWKAPASCPAAPRTFSAARTP